MSTVVSGTPNLLKSSFLASYIEPFVADFAVLATFALCYFIFKYFNKSEPIKKEETKKEPTAPSKWNGKTLAQFFSAIQYNNDRTIDAFKILTFMHKAGLVPDCQTYNCLIDMSFRLDQTEVAKKLLEEISDFTSPVQPDVITFNILLKGKINEIRENKETNKEECINEAKSLLKEMKERSITPNAITYNTLIDLCVEIQNMNLSWEFYQEMKERNILPDVYTYATIIKGLKIGSVNNEENLTRALEILERVKNGECGDVKSDDILYNSVLDICVKYNKMDIAEKLLGEMKSLGIKPTIVTFSILIKGYGASCKLQSAMNTFNELVSSGIKPNDVVYGALLSSASKCNRTDIMNEIYNKMISEGLTPNSVIYSTLIRAYIKSKNFVKCYEIANSIPERQMKDANISLYNALLDAYAEGGNYEKLFELYEYMKKKSEEDEQFPRMTVASYSTLIKGYAKSGQSAKARSLYQTIKANAHNPDEILFNTVADSFAKAGEIDMALQVLKDMKSLGLKRDHIIYAVLIKAYCNKLDEEKCLETFDEMLKDNILPNTIVYTTLMQMFIKKKKLDQAIGIFTDMKVNKCNPDAVSYNFIINGCTFNQRLEKAIEFLIEAMDKKVNISPETYKNVIEYLLSNKFMKVPDRIRHAKNIVKEMKENNIKINDDLSERIAKLIYNQRSYANEQAFNRIRK